jgi:hypothetical protein
MNQLTRTFRRIRKARVVAASLYYAERTDRCRTKF